MNLWWSRAMSSNEIDLVLIAFGALGVLGGAIWEFQGRRQRSGLSIPWLVLGAIGIVAGVWGLDGSRHWHLLLKAIVTVAWTVAIGLQVIGRKFVVNKQK